MKSKRLQAWIPADLYDRILQESNGRTSEYTEQLLKLGLAVKQGEITESESLPLIHQMMQAELRKTEARLRATIREDLEHDIAEPMREMNKRSDNRLAALTVQSIREAGLARRILFAFVARAVGEDFARAVFEGAKEAIGRDLSGNRKGDPYQV